MSFVSEKRQTASKFKQQGGFSNLFYMEFLTGLQNNSFQFKNNSTDFLKDLKTHENERRMKLFCTYASTVDSLVDGAVRFVPFV